MVCSKCHQEIKTKKHYTGPTCRPCHRRANISYMRAKEREAGKRARARGARKEYMRAYFERNRERVYARCQNWRERNREKVNGYYDKYSATGRGRLTHRASSNAYRARKLRAMPPWVDTTELTRFYQGCPAGYDVDHIVPLKGENVCGLHVLWNLQYLPAYENRVVKRNKVA